jgi:hypothetical protein
MFLATGPDGDFYILSKGCQKLHEAADGKIARAIPHQQRDLRLPHAENFGDLDLGHASVLEDYIELQSELRPDQFLFGIGKAQVCEDISAAFGYASHTLIRLLRF